MPPGSDVATRGAALPRGAFGAFAAGALAEGATADALAEGAAADALAEGAVRAWPAFEVPAGCAEAFPSASRSASSAKTNVVVSLVDMRVIIDPYVLRKGTPRAHEDPSRPRSAG
jgi:hypothetical protein